MFNWVHKKFHYNPLQAECTQTVKKNAEFAMKEVEKRGLLKEVDEIVDALEKWRINGGLTICAVGFQKPSKPKKVEYFILSKENKLTEAEILGDVDEELNPLTATTFPNNFDGDSTALEKSEVIVAIDHAARRIRKRITLGELFMADSDAKQKAELEKVVLDFGKKPEVQTTNAHSLANKLKEGNFGGLMRKMMKRKVHAEVDHQKQKR